MYATPYLFLIDLLIAIIKDLHSDYDFNHSAVLELLLWFKDQEKLMLKNSNLICGKNQSRR